MYYDLNFKKSLILMYNEYNEYNIQINTFLVIIKKAFSISKSAFYRWLKDTEIINLKIKNNNTNLKITPVAEKIILLNANLSVNKIKQQLYKLNIFLNVREIRYVLNKSKTINKDDNNNNIINNENNNDNNNNIINNENNNDNNNNIINNNDNNDVTIINKMPLKNPIFIKLNQENETFILDNSDKQTKKIKYLFYEKFKIDIHEKQIINILHKNKKKSNSFYKISLEIENFINECFKKNCLYRIDDIKKLIFTNYKLNISIQSIYKILKKNCYVYKRLKKNNNLYSIEEQVKQFEEIIKKHNSKTIDNCISLDEISVVHNSRPNYGWFKKNEEPTYKMSIPNIHSKRYSVIMASNNKKVIDYYICEKGVKTNDFIKFMNQLVSKNENKNSYYLLDNARVHKTKLFKKFIDDNKLNIVYNAPYHSETNPIENIFSIFRNKLNRSENKNYDDIIKIINDFMNEDNKIKFNNIFNHSINVINEFINDNKNKNKN